MMKTGAYKAVNHLFRSGKKRIVHLAGPEQLAIARNRLNGYLKAMKEYRLTPSGDDIIKCDDIECAEITVPRLLMRKPTPDAFFAVNDLTAAQTLMIVKRLGFKVPGDIAIVGFTNSQIATLTDPGLTSVDQKGYEMGQMAAKLLLDRIENLADSHADEDHYLGACHKRIFLGKSQIIRKPPLHSCPDSLGRFHHSAALCDRIMLE